MNGPLFAAGMVINMNISMYSSVYTFSNLYSARRGVKQIINYNELLGGGFKMVIVLY